MKHGQPFSTFSAADIQNTQPAMKIGLLATVTPQGLPHVTLLSTLMACGPDKLVFGQFAEGLSKQFLRTNPKVGFLIMSLDRKVWRGQAAFTHTAREGQEYDYYNNIPMFRYNAYFGVHTVYYLELLGHTGCCTLPMKRIIPAALQSRFARMIGRKLGQESVLNRWTQPFLNRLTQLKFLAYVDADGYPHIIPAMQTQCLDAQHVLFSTFAYREELAEIPAGINMAVFGMSLSMEDVLLRGTYLGIRRVGGMRCGVVTVDWVYNSMPPTPGQIYPPVPIQTVVDF